MQQSWSDAVSQPGSSFSYWQGICTKYKDHMMTVLMTEGCTRLQGASSRRGFEKKTYRFMAKWMDQAWTWGFPWVIWVMSIFCFSNLMVCSHVLCPFSSTVGIKGSRKLEWGVNKAGAFIGHDRLGKTEKSFQTSI